MEAFPPFLFLLLSGEEGGGAALPGAPMPYSGKETGLSFHCAATCTERVGVAMAERKRGIRSPTRGLANAAQHVIGNTRPKLGF